jgi:hypothetical protein
VPHEQSASPSAFGKKNWLFMGHPQAGERSAVIYKLLGSCRRHGLNPFDYLKDLFTRLPAAKLTQNKEFTPSAWATTKVNVEVGALAPGTAPVKRHANCRHSPNTAKFQETAFPNSNHE